jgi:hypothetical protein
MLSRHAASDGAFVPSLHSKVTGVASAACVGAAAAGGGGRRRRLLETRATQGAQENQQNKGYYGFAQPQPVPCSSDQPRARRHCDLLIHPAQSSGNPGKETTAERGSEIERRLQIFNETKSCRSALDRGAIGWSRMPMARIRCKKAGPYDVSRSRLRYRGAWSHVNASVTWREIHSAVGFAAGPGFRFQRCALKREARIPRISLTRSVIRMRAYGVPLLRLRRIDFSVHTGAQRVLWPYPCEGGDSVLELTASPLRMMRSLIVVALRSVAKTGQRRATVSARSTASVTERLAART